MSHFIVSKAHTNTAARERDSSGKPGAAEA
jgi:hypothetical protein